MMLFNKQIGVFAFFIYTLYSNGNLSAQSTTEDRRQLYWTRYYAEISLGESYRIDAEVGNRRFATPHAQYQHFGRITFLKSISDNFEWGTGLNYNELHSINSALRLPEIRPHQQIEAQHGFGNFEFVHRLRTEQQFLRDSTQLRVQGEIVGESLDNTSSFTFRARYLLGIRLNMVDKDDKAGHFQLELRSEIIGNAVRNEEFDQFRAYAGIVYKLLDPLALELGYMKYYEKEYVNNILFNFDVLRFTLRHKL